MKIDAITFNLGGDPPVKVRLVSSAGLSPLPIPRAVSRFDSAMGDDMRGTETPLVYNPIVAPPAPDAGVQVQSPPSAAAASSARTEAIAETVNEIVDAVVDKISVTPALVRGECEIRIALRPAVLDGSIVNMSVNDGELTVSIAPATQAAAQSAAAALPRLEAALAAHAPAFRHVAVVLAASKKGKSDETV